MKSAKILIAAIAASMMSPALADDPAPNGGRGAGTVPIWNPHRPEPSNQPLTIRVLVLNYNPIVPFENNRRLSEVFGWNKPADLATGFREAMEYATGGYLHFEIVEWRDLNEIYAKEDGYRYTIEEYVRNRRRNSGWGEHGNADYPRIMREQDVAPMVDDGRVDEVWVFSDHFFGLWEASMAGPGAFNINGGVYPQVPSRRPFTIYGFNYERGVAEMMHDAAHRTEATLNRFYGEWNLKTPKNNWEKFSANASQSGGLAGVGTCHWPANGEADYDYENVRIVQSWADAFLGYPKLDLTKKSTSRTTWSRGPDPHLDYMKWYFAHIPRAAGLNPDGRQNNWLKYIFDFSSYDMRAKPLASSARWQTGDLTDRDAKSHTILVAYRSPDLVDGASLGDSDLLVTTKGKPIGVKLVGGGEPGWRPYRVGRYEIQAPGGSWAKSSAGPYNVELKAGEVRDLKGKPIAGGKLGNFRLREKSDRAK